ncbi:hypothetical protein SAMN02787142_4324 [Burkholderia sp. WP9]|uniref:hypothetical protein n=1 Tax=Burkholderia sp. WP9 TaxID=1500263 RepID=UPI000894478D|nr:hypothetical protein [Burkholderia sp. WP9]SEE00710.1 hypothetical protein SAMN02787142_4324 [Burkholderia sp. WP9]
MQEIERQEAVTPSTITGGGVHFSAAAMRALVRYAGRAGVAESAAWLAHRWRCWITQGAVMVSR